MLPRLVIFDMDDVLCAYDLGRRLRLLSRISGQTPRDIRAALWDSDFEGEADAGAYPDPAQYLAEFGKRLNYPISEAEWLAARRGSMEPFPEVLDLARRIGRLAELALYTNNGPLVKHRLEALFPEAAAIFLNRFCSYEFGTKKPDPASFRKLTDRLGADPAACWFIDDKRSNVQGARMAGLIGHHFRGFLPLREEARRLGFAV
jgi:putative hydrolase of the HAD superfamily